MDLEGSRTLEMAALGRPFTLGMLYDCRQDTLVPGITLWDCSDLEKDTRWRPKPSRFFEIVASESIEDKSSALKVEASLKASFLGGLVEVEGSAKYLNDNKTSKNQARVTLNYMATTKFQELSMNHLGVGNVKHQNVFDKGLATHVVTGILYGAQAFFVFDREVSDKEVHQDIQGNLKAVINKIPCLSIEGQGSLQMEDKDRGHVEKLSCKFHGDFSLQRNPVSFQDAVEVYQTLPNLLGADGENAVPMKVWLLPLTSLDSAAAKLVRQISIRLVQESQSVLEEFSELEIRCNDALKTPTAQQFPQIGKKIKTFKEMCSEYRQDFQRKLAMKLPLIRGGGEEEAVLSDILKKRHSSPFNSTNLSEWMDCKEREICLLKSFTNMMKNTKIAPKVLHQEILGAEHAVCFAFTTLGNPEPYLSTLSNYLKQDNTQDGHTLEIEKQQWYLDSKLANELRHKAKLFSDFAEANEENQKIKFLAVGDTNETQKGSCIYLYKNGFRVNENFEPPSEPETVTVTDINHNSITVAIHPPKFGAANVTSYSVEYSVGGKLEWKQQAASKAEEVTVNGLSPNTEYVFRCRAVTAAGVGPANQISGSIKTLPCSPPGKPQVEPNSSEISVRWEKPTELGHDVNILSYIVEYAKNGVKDPHWSQTMAGAEKVIISGLHTETEYAVRIRCDCGIAGRSKESVVVIVCTPKREFARLAEFLKHISRRISSGSPTVYRLPLTEEDIDIDGCRKYILGRDSMRQNRTIMLLGATGSGKSTLINGMINYIVGVEWADPFRFKLVHEDPSKSQAESQTSEVTVYQINHQEGFRVPFSLTIVDTPGFGDTRGIARDREITEQIRRLFTSANGVSEIDVVSFVTQASLARLTATQKYVFDSVLSIFGKDVAENIEMLVTFADGKQPPVLEAINASNVPCPKNDLGLPVHFKFNNSALFADNRSGGDRAHNDDSDSDDDHFDQMFWSMGAKSMQKFFTGLINIKTKSLLMTQEVLRERKHLEAAVEGLQPQVKAGLAKLAEIRSTKEKIKEQEAVMTMNANHTIEVELVRPVKIELTKSGEHITNCAKCSVTCHYPCMLAKDSEKKDCAAMDGNGKCTVCPGKCVWSVHFNQTYRWDYHTVKEKQTLQELKDKYKKATEEKLSVQELMERQEEEIDQYQEIIVSLIDQSAQSITRLQEIALRPNPLSTPEYIEMLIEAEKSEAKEGYTARVKLLEAMKEKAKIISKVKKRERLVRTEEELAEAKKKKQENKGYLSKFLSLFKS